MVRLTPFAMIAAILSGCQTTDQTLATNSTPVALSGAAAGAIAGDMASRLAEQITPAGNATIEIKKDGSDFELALEAALKGWGYAVVTDGTIVKDQKPVQLTWSLASADGQVLAQLTTQSMAIGRAYLATPAGATPASPLSVIQRN